MPSDFFWISYASRRRPQMSSLSTDPPPLVMIFRYCSSVGWTERSSVSGSRITMTSYLRMRELHLLWSRRPRDGPVAGGRMLEADPSVSRPRVAAPERTPESSVPGRNRARQFRPGAPEPAAIRDRRGLGVRSSALRQAQGTGVGRRPFDGLRARGSVVGPSTGSGHGSGSADGRGAGAAGLGEQRGVRRIHLGRLRVGQRLQRLRLGLVVHLLGQALAELLRLVLRKALLAEVLGDTGSDLLLGRRAAVTAVTLARVLRLGRGRL